MPPRGSDARASEAEAQRLARKARRQADRRSAILAAARRVLVEGGIGALTIAAVAAEAGVSKPAVYYYFTSREEVLGSLAVDIFEGEVAQLERAIEQAGSGVAALEALVRAKVDRYGADLDAFRIAYVWPQLVPLPPALLQERIYPLSARINDTLEQRLVADRRAGRLHRSLHPRRLANLAWITAHGLLALVASLDAAGGSTAASLDQLRDEACALLRRAAAG
jgi:TetR/AcrR family transcriptional regulator